MNLLSSDGHYRPWSTRARGSHHSYWLYQFEVSVCTYYFEFFTVVDWFWKFQCVAEYTNIIPTNYTWTLPQTCVVLSILKYRTNQVSDMVYCSSRFNRTILKLVITLSATTNLLVHVLVNNARDATFVWGKMKYLIIFKRWSLQPRSDYILINSPFS